MTDSIIQQTNRAATKRCNGCTLELPISEFYLKSGKPGARRSRCKACYNTQARERLSAKPGRNLRCRSFVDSQTGALVKQCSQCSQVKPLDDYCLVYRYGKQCRMQPCRACTRLNGKGRMRDPQKSLDIQNRRRARMAGVATIEKIDRTAIIERDASTCYLCLRVLTKKEITLDHVVPLTRGGSHTYDNLRVCCRPCNTRKKSQLLQELSWLPAGVTF